MRFSLVLIAVFLTAFPALAQESVEIYLENLDGYKPPPMFTGEKPGTKETEKEAGTAVEYAPLTAPLPLDTIYAQEIDPPSATPAKDSESPPLPESKPAKTAKSNTAVAAVKPPPLPPKRPGKLSASAGFARETLEHPKPPNPNIESADPLQRELKEPTAKEVRDQIAGIIKEPLPPETPRPEPQEKSQAQEQSAFISLGYDPEFTGLTNQVKQALENQFLRIAREHPDQRIEIHAYASSKEGNDSTARRTSLSRALDIREFMIEQKIDPKRIDLRALGDKTDKEPVDRVEIYLR